MESVLKQVDINHFRQKHAPSVRPSIPTPQVIGRTSIIPQISLFEADDDDVEIMVNENEQWEEVEFEAALDSGSIVNVCHPDDAPGYMLMESAGSKTGQHFIVGDGGTL